MITRESDIFTKYQLRISATSLSSVTRNSFSNRIILEEACILSEKSGLTIFQKFRFKRKEEGNMFHKLHILGTNDDLLDKGHGIGSETCKKD